MRKKSLIFLGLIVTLLILSVSMASAQDVDNATSSTDEIELAAGDDEKVIDVGALASTDDETNVTYSETDVVGDSGAANYYVDKTASGDGDGSFARPFNNLKSAISKAGAGDSIYIASGTYTGADNIGLTISKSLNLIGKGSGDVVFDAQNNGRIFTVSVNSIRIDGLTFTGASDSALVFTKGLNNGVIVADFNENKKDNGNGAAVYVLGSISNSLFIGDFKSNSAKNGAAIYADEISASTFNGDFTDNIASEDGGAIHANIVASTFNGDFTGNRACDGGAIFGNIDDSVFNGDFTRNSAADGNDVLSAQGDGEILGFALAFGGGCMCGNVAGTTFNTNFIYNTANAGAVIKGNVEKSVFTGKFSQNAANEGIIVSGNTLKSVFSGDIIDHVGNLFSGWLDSFIKNQFLDKDDKNLEELENLSKELEIEVESDLEIYVDSASTLKPDEVYVSFRINWLNFFLVKAFKYGTPKLKEAANPFEGLLGDIAGELIDDLFDGFRDNILDEVNEGKSTAYLTMEIRTLNNLKDATTIANHLGLMFKEKYFKLTKSFTLNDISVKIAPGVYKGDNNKGLEMNASYTLMKDGEGDVIIDAENDGTILTVNWPEIKIDGMTFTHASNSAIIFKKDMYRSVINANFIENSNKFYGGAIYCQGDIKNSVFNGTFSDNSVGSMKDTGAMYYGYGGAIYANNIESSTFDSDFINNSASTKSRIDGNSCYGGAIYANNISKSEFNGKFTNNWGGFFGGAINVNNNIVHSVFNSDFMNNKAIGGAIKAKNIKNSTFDGIYMNNSAFTASDLGAGAIYVVYDIEQSTFNGDFANNYGANYGGVLHCSNLKNSIFSGNCINNKAKYKGGAIYVTENIVDCEVTGNFINNRVTDKGYSLGGAIYAYNIKNSDFYGKYIDNSAYHGGAIYVHDIYYSNFNGEYSGNSAEEGNVLYASSFYDIPEYGDYYNNKANIPKSDVYDDAYEWYIALKDALSCSFDDAEVLSASENGIYVDQSAALNGDGSSGNPFNNLNSALDSANSGDTIYIAPGTYVGEDNIGLTITKRLNLVKNGNGEAIFDAQNNGGIFTIVANSFNITGLTFTRASASALVFLNGLVDSRIDTVFKDNKNTGGDGAAVFVRGYVSDTVFSGSYLNNAANGDGGAIYAEGIVSCVFNAYFKNNTAKADGGAIAADVMSCTFNGAFTSNSATKGGAIYGNISTTRFAGAFTNNKATDGGVIHGSVSSSNFTGDFTGNGATGNGGVINGRVSNSNFICNFKSNSAKNAAIVYSDGDLSKSVFKGNFIDNTANSNYGKLIYVVGSISSSNFVASVFTSHLSDMDSIIYSKRGIIVDCSFGGITINAPDVTMNYGESKRLEVTLSENDKPISKANVKISLNGATYTKATDSSGKAYLDLKLNAGTYDAVITYGDVSTSARVTVNKLTTKTTLNVVKNSYNSVTLTAVVDLASAGGKVTFKVGSKEYTADITGSQATFRLENLTTGSYSAKATYSGDANHKSSSSAAVTFAIDESEVFIPQLDTVSSEGIEINLPGDAGGNVTLTVNGHDYVFDVVNGSVNVRLPSLATGNYPYTLTYSGDGKYAPVTTNGSLNKSAPKVDPMIAAKNTAVQYSAKGKYSVTVYGTNGKVASGVQVIFKISGKQVGKAKTNSKGVASYVVTKNPGKYKIQATALGKSITKTVTVKHIVTLKTVTLKKSAKKLTLQATLAKVNGKYLKKKTVTFKINGKKVATAKTNSKGVAKITIKNPSVVKKLKVGKKITYQATYLKDTVKKTAKVKK